MSLEFEIQPSNSHIEKTANGIITEKLRNFFLTKNLELGENKTDTSQERGIDFYIEVFDKNNGYSREMLFLLQCKGTNIESKILKNTNIISFNMSLRHANYFYYQLSEPLLFFVCDIQSRNIYWYAVQLDQQLETKIFEQAKQGKESLQVKIPLENELNKENFERFLIDLDESRKIQLHKKREQLYRKANYDVVNKSIGAINIVEDIFNLLQMFEGINVFPKSIINNFKIFTGSEGSLYGETLTTDNEFLFDLLDNLEIKDDVFTLKNNEVNYAGTSDLQDKLRHILNFFRANWIMHVSWRGRGIKKTNNRICVHNLFTSKECNCERCSYNKLDFPRAIELLNSDINIPEIAFRLRKAYTYYLISDLEKSYKEHKKVIAEIDIKKSPGLYIISKYNLLQLKRMIDWGYFGDARQEILMELENETFAMDEILLPEYFLDIFKRIGENRFVNEALWDIDNKLNDIQKNWYSDQYGGSSTNSYAQNLIVEFLRAYNFVEYNHLIYNHYSDFETLVNKTLEGIFALYAINNPQSSKYEHFGYTIVDMWLFHADPKHIKHLLSKYRLKSLDMEFSDIEYTHLLEYMDNLINSATIIIENFKKKNYDHSDKIRKIIQNYLVIISVVNLSDNERNILLSKYLYLIETIGEWYFTSFEYLIVSFHNDTKIDKENLEKLINIQLVFNNTKGDVFSEAINAYIKNFTNASEIESSLKNILKIKSFTAEDFCSYDKYSNLVFIIDSLTNETRELIKKDLIAKLSEKFDGDLYYRFSIHDVIDFNESFFKNYCDLTPDYNVKRSGHEMLTGKKELKNYHLDRILNLIFHYDLQITPEIKALSKRALDKEYYDWIMDIDGFDYSKFNSYWILHYKTDSYFKRYRKSEKLKSELIASLKENYIEGVAKILINKLSN
jgi:hypothetical protein